MIGRILAIVVCIVFSAFFSGSEIAYNILNENRLKQHGKNKDGALTGRTVGFRPKAELLELIDSIKG